MSRSGGRIGAIAEKVEAGERLIFEEGVELFERATLLELSAMADRVRWRLTATRQFYLSFVICDSMAAI